MKKIQCPWCGEETFSILTKLYIGPLIKIKCKQCKELVGVPWVISLISSVLTTVLFFVGAIVPLFMFPERNNLEAILFKMVFGCFLAILVIVYLYLKFVPLIKK